MAYALSCAATMYFLFTQMDNAYQNRLHSRFWFVVSMLLVLSCLVIKNKQIIYILPLFFYSYSNSTNHYS
jgi:hypothetical protein